MKREGFIFYRSFYESIKELEPQDQVEIYNAIFEYQFENKEIELSKVAKSIFTLIVPQLKANNTKYENGCKGGRPKNNLDKTETKPKNNLDKSEAKRKEKEKEKDNDKDKDNDKVKNNIVYKKQYYEKEELNNLFLEFLELRKKKKAVNSERAINMLIKKLSNYDDDIKKQMIERSILNSWKDVYEIKKEEVKKYSDEWWEKI